MVEVDIWIGIGTVATVITLLISIIKIWLDLKKSNKSLEVLSEMTNLYRKEVELLQRELPEKISLERERLALENEIHTAKEKWKQLETVGKIFKYILDNE